MNPNELLNQVKELIEKKDFSAAQKFINDNKDQLGDYFEQAKKLVEGAGGVDGVLDKVKGLFSDK
ncbi:hypothetical protein SAMN02910293_01464 [Streptococcus henryi]|uniref:Isoleucyl-tRNA synthetase n=1 Tax=Streptococcus henryi TaxID=439219 RepID=A0A1G6C8V4_9STRE|nr:hypothetical protein [Streptococcus henryi]SDB29272.1 hypothetical protein SAMN02910293_01464 [Streptococcus henryi]